MNRDFYTSDRLARAQRWGDRACVALILLGFAALTWFALDVISTLPIHATGADRIAIMEASQ